MMLQPFSLPGCLVQFAVAILATVCFAVAFQAPRRHFWCCGLTGAVGWLVYILCTAAGLSGPVATLVAALPLTGLARFFAIAHRAPITLFLLCGIFPLVPGAGIYYTAYYLLTNQETLFAAKGVETLKIAVALALGIAIVCSIPLPGRWSRRQYRGPKPN